MIKIPKDVAQYANRESAKILKDNFRRIIEPRFVRLKQQMIQEFLNHPITEEIKSGPKGTNTSGTLGGYGNLFTFIGFEDNSDPIRPIVDILESTQIIYSGISLDGITKYRVILPTSEDVFNVTDMPWANGRSWAKGIESGLSGLGYYLNTTGGRSSKGIQSRKKMSRSASSFKNTQYVSALIKKYSILFEKL